MLVRHAFDVVFPLFLGLIALVALYGFWRTWRRRGLKAAIATLTTRRAVIVAAVLAGVSYIRAGLEFIDPREVGVVVSLLQPHGVRPEPLGSGLHWVWPVLERVYTYPIIVQAYTMSHNDDEGEKFGDDAIAARTADGQLVYMDVTVLYRIDPAKAVFLHTFYQSRYIDVLLRPGLRSLVRKEASQYTVDQINSQRRADFQRSLDQNIRVICKGSSLLIEQVLLRNIAFSPEYATAVEDKMMALQGVTRSTYEARQIANLAEGEAQRIERTAQAQARATVERAQAYAEATVLRAEAEAQALRAVGEPLEQRPDLLTYRYIDRLAPNLKAVLVPANAPLVLPLSNLLTDETTPVADHPLVPEAAPPPSRQGPPLSPPPLMTAGTRPGGGAP
ncbi:MAG: SPFH domain-containing protein [Candidatus Competibacterales bacterium]